jgi:hypothetical protein
LKCKHETRDYNNFKEAGFVLVRLRCTGERGKLIACIVKMGNKHRQDSSNKWTKKDLFVESAFGPSFLSVLE